MTYARPGAHDPNAMRVAVVVMDADEAKRDADGAVVALCDLGCEVIVSGLDFDELAAHMAGNVDRPPTVLILDFADRVDLAQHVLPKLRRQVGLGLEEVPALLVVPAPRLPGLAFSPGAPDDFVLRPIVPAELYARIRQLDWRTSAFAGEELIKLGAIVLDMTGHEVTVAGRAISLTPQEYDLLHFLAMHPGKAFSREELLRRVWGHSYEGGTRTVDIHVLRLRAKLGSEHARIETVRNVGYKLRGK